MILRLSIDVLVVSMIVYQTQASATCFRLWCMHKKPASQSHPTNDRYKDAHPFCGY